MTRVGISEIPPLYLVLLRLSFAAVLFAVALAALRRPLPRSRRTWFDIALVGLCNTGLPLVLFTLSLQYLSSGVVTIFVTLVPMLTGLLAHLWLAHEKLTTSKFAGLAVGLAGILFLILTRTTGLAEGEIGDIRGHVLALIATLITAFAVVYARRQLQAVDIMVVTGGQMLVGALLIAPFALALDTPDWALVTWRGWLAMTYTAVMGSFVGFTLVFYLIKRFGAVIGSLPTYVMPVVSSVLGALLLGEIITPTFIVGAVLVLLGVFWVSR
jgi:drug/metabolite transporter (DMT)-like permease